MSQRLPERPVLGVIMVRRFDEHRVVLPLHLGPGVAHRHRDVGIGRQDDAVRLARDHCRRSMQGTEHTPRRAVLEQQHPAIPGVSNSVATIAGDTWPAIKLRTKHFPGTYPGHGVDPLREVQVESR